jgi:hypothetical protein
LSAAVDAEGDHVKVFDFRFDGLRVSVRNPTGTLRRNSSD